MKQSKNYNILRTAATALSGVLGVTAIAACGQEVACTLPATVFVQQVGGKTFLQGCFTGLGNKDIAFNEVGTLTLTPEADDEWKFTFRTADDKHSRLIDMADLAKVQLYDPGADPLYTAPQKAGEDVMHQIMCRQELYFGSILPADAKNQFATSVVRSGYGFVKHMIGPINSETHKVVHTEGLGEYFTPVGNKEVPIARIVP